MILTWTPYVVRGKTYWQLNAPGFRSPLRTGACASGIGHVGWREARTWRAEVPPLWHGVHSAAMMPLLFLGFVIYFAAATWLCERGDG